MTTLYNCSNVVRNRAVAGPFGPNMRTFRPVIGTFLNSIACFPSCRRRGVTSSTSASGIGAISSVIGSSAMARGFGLVSSAIASSGLGAGAVTPDPVSNFAIGTGTGTGTGVWKPIPAAIPARLSAASSLSALGRSLAATYAANLGSVILSRSIISSNFTFTSICHSSLSESTAAIVYFFPPSFIALSGGKRVRSVMSILLAIYPRFVASTKFFAGVWFKLLISDAKYPLLQNCNCLMDSGALFTAAVDNFISGLKNIFESSSPPFVSVILAGL